MESMPLEFRRPVASGTKSRAQGASMMAGVDAAFGALQAALDGSRGVAQQRALRRIADNSPAVQNTARLQRMIAGHDEPVTRPRIEEGRPSLSAARAEGILQRRLMIERGHYLDRFRQPQQTFKFKVIAALNTLLAGTDFTASETNGVVSLSSTDQSGDPRVGLLRSIINSPRTVTVRPIKTPQNQTLPDAGLAGVLPGATLRGVKAAATTGTDAQVLFNPEHQDSIEVWDPEQGAIVREDMPSFLILAHELVHAERALRGKAANDPKTGERLEAVYKNFAGELDVGHLEELQTVGLPLLDQMELESALEGNELRGLRLSPKFRHLLRTADTENEAPFTENKIRAALNLKLRAKYATVKSRALTTDRPEGLGSAMDRLSAAKRGPNWRSVAAAATAVGVPLIAFLAWYLRSGQAGAPVIQQQRDPSFGSNPHAGGTAAMANSAASAPHVDAITSSPVTQRVLDLRHRNWSEATSVTVLREGVYRVDGQSGEALVIKTSADVKSPTYEYVGAYVGKSLGVNTVDTEAVKIKSLEIQEAVPHFKQLGGGGAALANAIGTSQHQFILVMSYIKGADLNKSGAAWAKAGVSQQKEWAQQMGKAWLLDLLLQNPDRHSENFMIDESGSLFAIDQVVGPGLIEGFGPEKVTQVLKNLPKAKMMYYQKLTSDLDFEIDQEIFFAGFDEGVAAARKLVGSVKPGLVKSMFDKVEEGESNVKLPGLPGVIEAIEQGFS
jgi:hypothetical protein